MLSFCESATASSKSPIISRRMKPPAKNKFSDPRPILILAPISFKNEKSNGGSQASTEPANMYMPINCAGNQCGLETLKM